ncbi:dihydrolipoyl dehydrogenase [Mesomycoplasma conjunctivae]|uniref:dihydrolipoyl dehydrogenase n=1 Tax=Mesomycoplasma conjunctivae TaxID=45361 RepID=UPI003DA6BC2E
MNKFDIAVIGAGPGGYSLALILAKAGNKVVIFEESFFGGTCVNRGCIPTKTLMKSARIANTLARSKDFGIDSENYYDLQVMFKNVANNSAKLQNAIKGGLTNSNVTIIEASATVIDEHTIEASGSQYSFDKLVIASGSRPNFFKIEGAETTNVYTSDDLLTKNPKFDELTIIGGGAISLEFAYFYASFGKKVTIIEAAPQLFANLDESISRAAKAIIAEKGITLYEATKVLRYEDGALILENRDGHIYHKTNNILLAVGRRANNEAFASLNLKFNEKKFVEVNEFFQTSIDHIYAIGDVTGKLMLSTVAYKHGDIVAKHIITGSSDEKFDARFIPWTIYATPEIASVGSSEQQLQAQGIDYEVAEIAASSLPRAHAENAFKLGFIKLIFNKKTFEILGATIFLDEASLLINQIALAIKSKLTILDLQKSAYTHPTLSESIYYITRQIVFSNLDK